MKMEQYYEDNFKTLNTSIIISKRTADGKSLGCLINMHEYIEFYYVIKGGVKLFCNGSSQWVYSGDVAFINWCQPHRSLCFLDHTAYYNIQLDLNTLTCGNADLFQTKYVSKLISDMKYFKQLFQGDQTMTNYFRSLTFEFEHRTFTSELIIQSAICNILAYIINSENKHLMQDNCSLSTEASCYAKKVMQYLYGHYQNEITIDHIARHLGISPSYMCRIFKQFTGTTIIEYLNQIRCKRAISFMKEGCSMTQASAFVGYNDYTYFSRIFKKIYGVPPKEFIRNKASLRNDIERFYT